MSNIPRVHPENGLLSYSTDDLGKMLLRREWKSVEWTMDLVPNFCKAGKLVRDTCTGTLVTAKECLQVAEHHCFLVRGGLRLFSVCFSVANGSICEAAFESLLRRN